MKKLSNEKLEKIKNFVQSDSGKAFLDLISTTEGADYNSLVYGGTISDFSKHPNIKKKADIRLKDGSVSKGHASTSAGRYQFNNPTWKDVVKASGGAIKDFSPQSQDLAAAILLESTGALDAWNSGDYGTAIKKASSRWASLPGSKSGMDKYSLADVKNILAAKPGIDKTKLANLSAAQPTTKSNQQPVGTKNSTPSEGNIRYGVQNKIFNLDDLINSLSTTPPVTQTSTSVTNPAVDINTELRALLGNNVTLSDNIDYDNMAANQVAAPVVEDVTTPPDYLDELNESLSNIRESVERERLLAQTFDKLPGGYVPMDVSKYIEDIIRSG